MSFQGECVYYNISMIVSSQKTLPDGSRVVFSGHQLQGWIDQRLDVFLAHVLDRSRAAVQRLIRNGLVTVEGSTVKPGYRIKKTDTIQVLIPEEPPPALLPQPVPLEVLFMDDYLIVVNKPPGIVMYPSHGHPDGTLLNGIYSITRKLASAGGPLRPGVVHRLDKDTSGAVVVALDDRAYYGLVEQFKTRSIERHYLALVHGRFAKPAGTIDLPIGRSKTHRKKFSTRTRVPKEAVTHWQVIESFHEATLLKITLATGRTHQIRVHMSSIGHPVLGDSLYGRKTWLSLSNRRIKIPRQMLHAEGLGFVHPVTGQKLRFYVPVFEDMKEILQILRISNGHQ